MSIRDIALRFKYRSEVIEKHIDKIDAEDLALEKMFVRIFGIWPYLVQNGSIYVDEYVFVKTENNTFETYIHSWSNDFVYIGNCSNLLDLGNLIWEYEKNESQR